VHTKMCKYGVYVRVRVCACVCACATPSDTQTLAAKEEGDKIHAGSKDAARVWAQIRLLHGCSRHFFAAFSSVFETQDRDQES